MTTANRPTYYPAVGKQQFGGLSSRRFSVRDQTAHTKLKFRELGQSSSAEKKDRGFQKKELDLLEKHHLNPQHLQDRQEAGVSQTLLLLQNENAAEESARMARVFDDADASIEDSGNNFDSSSGSDDNSDDEEDLQAELEKIRTERAAAQEKRENVEKETQAEEMRVRVAQANPNIAIEENSAKVKRRWNDDVVFRNQARDEPGYKKRFVNDTVRSDFHRNFLHKYIK